MLTDIGEYIVGAYLKLKLDCDFVDYNVRPPGGGLKGLNELDVIGLDFKNDYTYICEVTTHIRGTLYNNNNDTIERIRNKNCKQKEYADKYLSNFTNHIFMFWAPVVPVGYLTENLAKIENLELIINGEYKKRIEELRKLAKTTTYNANNPFFRMLQIIEHLKD